MKKQWKVLFLLIISCGLLFACSQNEKIEGSKTDKENVVEKEKSPEEEQKEDQTDEQEEAEQEDETDDQLAEVLNQATEKNKAFKSYSIESITDTVEEFNGEKNHLLATELKDIILDPLQVEITIEQEQLEDSDHLQQEYYTQKGHIYLIDNTSYMYINTGKDEGEWIKSKNNSTEDEIRDEENINVQKVYESYQKMATSENFTETDEAYLIQFELDLEQVTESDKENAVDEPWVYDELSLNSYQVEELKVEIAIDKSSYYLTTITTNKLISYDMEFKDEKNKMTHTNEIVSTYKNHDEVKEIAVPNDVLENAREINN